MTKLLKNHGLPIQIEGLPYIIAGVLLSVSSFLILEGLRAGGIFSWPALGATVLFSLFTLFSIWFYRCPKIDTPTDDPLAVFSPANGRVLKIEEVSGKKIGEEKAKKISIFMSPVDVHVNRAPVQGVVESVEYVRGKFFKADLDKASEENEHNFVVMKTPAGSRVGFNQIAGFVARRIVCYVTQGEALSPGERYGMIRFGSRMEIMLPMSSEIFLKPGDRTVAGLTKVARLKS